jgi:hypothetical protein
MGSFFQADGTLLAGDSLKVPIHKDKLSCRSEPWRRKRLFRSAPVVPTVPWGVRDRPSETGSFAGYHLCEKSGTVIHLNIIFCPIHCHGQCEHFQAALGSRVGAQCRPGPFACLGADIDDLARLAESFPEPRVWSSGRPLSSWCRSILSMPIPRWFQGDRSFGLALLINI